MTKKLFLITFSFKAIITLYFALQEKNRENDQLKIQIEKFKSDCLKLQKENEYLKHVQQASNEVEHQLKRENNQLLAKIKQMKRDSLPKTTMEPTTPINTQKSSSARPELNKTPKTIKKRKLRNDLKEYEVESLIDHRKWRGKIQFLVRWKNYAEEEDRWIDEKNLNCPSLLKNYKHLHQM